MDNNLISVIDFASDHGFNKKHVFKVVSRLNIELIKSSGDKRHRGQMISYMSKDDAKRVLDEMVSSDIDSNNKTRYSLADVSLYDSGVFYLVQLEPEHDPNRFKVGFAINIDERMRQHRCSALFSQVIKTWPCRRLWEKTIIECVTYGCERLHTEVFRTSSLEMVEEKCSKIFSIMPPPIERTTSE